MQADAFGKGEITNDQLRTLMEDVHRLRNLEEHKLFWSEFTEIRKNAEKYNCIRGHEIVDFIKANASLAGPIFIIQTNLREKVIDAKFWVERANHRSSSKFSSCRDIT